MAKEFNHEAEAAFKAECAQVYETAFMELRDTLKPSFNPKTGGYGDTVEQARYNIINTADKLLNRMAAAHLKKWGG